MQFGRLTLAPRRVLILFLVVTLIPVASLAWLSWRLFEQDRELERQRLQDRLDRAAELVVAALQRRLSDTTEKVAAPQAASQRDLPEGAVAVFFDRNGVRASPQGRLPYYPVLPVPLKSDLEYHREDGADSDELFREYTRSQDLATRAAALIILAASHKRNGRYDDALVVYRDLEKLGPLPLRDGTPADFLARKAQCALLREHGKFSEWLQAASALNTDFENGRWALDRGSYFLYFEDAPRLFPPEAQPRLASLENLALAEGVEQLWAEWQQSRRDRPVEPTWRNAWIADQPILALWRGSGPELAGLVVGPDYLASQLKDIWEGQGVAIVLQDPKGRKVLGQAFTDATPFAERRAAATGLPWTIRVASADPAADSVAMTQRRRLLWTGLTLMGVLTLLGAGLTMRAAAREFAFARLQSDFVSAVSHEFRTPLTSLRHLTELLSNDMVLTDDRRRQYYGVMANETERLHRLVEGLLAFGRMEARRSDHCFERIDPVELTESAVAEFHLGRSHRVELTTNGVKPKTSIIRANREALSRAIRNLLENAVKYAPNAPLVQIHLARQGERLAIRVHDDGFGIPAAEQKIIFDKFVRGTAAKALNVPGTGIGLAMTQHIVRVHGGKLQLDSAPGRGTTFTIELPVTSA